MAGAVSVAEMRRYKLYLSGGRVRILTQETQKGKPAEELAKARPNPMINGHQEWLDGLVDAARKSKQ